MHILCGTAGSQRALSRNGAICFPPTGHDGGFIFDGGCGGSAGAPFQMKVAVVGATGVVGETILRVLEERRVPVDGVGLFASRTRGEVRETTHEALANFDAVFFASSEDASEKYAPPLLERGAVVIDNSSTFRMREDVPLIVPREW